MSGDDAVRERLRHVRWIAGASGAGKSTIARRLATRHGLRRYGTDDTMPDHARRSALADTPLLRAFIDMDLDERWVRRTPEVMYATFHWFAGEAFELIVEDLLAMPPAPGVIVEGFRPLPHLVRPLLDGPDRAVWLLPTPEFRRAVFDSRGGTSWSFIGRTSDPERALRNLLERERRFTEHLAAETARLGLRTIVVDGAVDEETTAELVARALDLPDS